MTNKIIYFLIFLGISFFIFSYFTPEPKKNWRGIYYPNGDILDQKSAISSQVYDNFNDCRNWANSLLTNNSNPDDRAACALNCKDPNNFSIIQDCQEIIRSWPMYPTTILLDNYKEE